MTPTRFIPVTYWHCLNVLNIAEKSCGENESAQLCLHGAKLRFEAKDLYAATLRATRCIQHSIGILHPHYADAYKSFEVISVLVGSVNYIESTNSDSNDYESWMEIFRKNNS